MPKQEDIETILASRRRQVSLGVRKMPAGARIVLRVGAGTLVLDADQADELSADLRMYALELRNGGQVV